MWYDVSHIEAWNYIRSTEVKGIEFWEWNDIQLQPELMIHVNYMVHIILNWSREME